jgi:hypothetical protein
MRKILSIIILSIGILTGCVRAEIPNVQSTPTPVMFSQWAIAAEANSQYGYPDWSAKRATGAPDVNACADDTRAWSSARGDGLAWLQLTYAKPVYATEVQIHQTFGRGAISKVSVLGESGTVDVVWEGTDVTEPCPGVLTIAMPRTVYRVTQVRIDLDESRTGFWNQIDAVALLGIQ